MRATRRTDPPPTGKRRSTPTAEFPHPYVTVDVALITVADGRLRVLLHRRPEPPAQGRWALPGGFVRVDESLDAAAARVLEQKAGLSGVFLEQLYTFGSPDRDPRTRVITVAYYALVAHERISTSFDERDNTALAEVLDEEPDNRTARSLRASAYLTAMMLDEALAEGADAVLLDNMGPADLARAVAMIDGRAISEAWSSR